MFPITMATFASWLMFSGRGIDEKLEEMKKEGKRQLSDEMSQAAAQTERSERCQQLPTIYWYVSASKFHYVSSKLARFLRRNLSNLSPIYRFDSCY